MDAKQTAGEPRALISRSALLHNVGVIRAALAPGVKICAIVKADAYGHDADLIVDTLSNFSRGPIEAPAVDMLAVASIDEAIALVETPLPILIFRPVEDALVAGQRSRLETAIRSGWILSICSAAAAGDVARIAQAIGKRASVQIMLDTGMTRGGAHWEALGPLIAKINSFPSLRLTGIYSHFACSEEAGHPFNSTQLDRYSRAVDAQTSAFDHLGAPRPGGTSAVRSIVRHLGNSGSVFFHADAHADMVRPGLSLYGIDPTSEPSIERRLRPVMKWTAPLLTVFQLKPGQSIGYGQTFIAEREMRVGLVPIGYADGYMRVFSNHGVMLMQGRPARVVGRVSMDLTTIDLTDIPAAATGDEVTVLDDDPLSPASVYRLAQWGDTIPYEIFCRIGARIRRVAVGEDPLRPPRPVTSHASDSLVE